MTSSSPSLPRDVLISIIDIYNDNGDMKMLKTWSLVNSDYLSICRPHIYRSFDMRNNLHREPNPDHHIVAASQKLFLKFHHLITCNQHLAPFVHTVHISEPGSSDYLRYLSLNLTCEHPNFSELLRLLTNLECFGMHFSEQVTWASLNRRVERTLTELCGRDNMRALHLSGIRRVPLGLLNRCTESLAELHLKDVMFADSNAPSSLVGRVHGSMSKSEVEDVGASHSRIPVYLDKASLMSSQLPIFTEDPPVLRIDLSRLQDLTIDFNFRTLNAVWDIISCSEKTLRRLSISQSQHALGHRLFSPTSFFETILAGHFESPQAVDIASTRATLAHLTSLSHLSVTMVFPRTRKGEAIEGAVEEWCALLDTVHKDSSVRTVTIILNVCSMGQVELGLLFWKGTSNQDAAHDAPHRFGAKWKGKEKEGVNRNLLACLDDTLAARGLFPMLSAVTIDVIVPREHTYPLGMQPTIKVGLRHRYSSPENSDGETDMESESHNDQSSAGIIRDIDVDATTDSYAFSRPNLHSFRQRRKAAARGFTFEEIETSVTRMMDRTRRRLGGRTQLEAGSFEVVVRVEN